MNAVLRDFSLLWRAALTIRHPRVNAWLGALALLAMLVVGLLTWVKAFDPLEVAINCLRACFVVMAFGWLMYFVPNAVKLSTPANAVLVPRVRRRLKQLTVLAWLAATTLSALLALGTPLPLHIPFLGVGCWLIALGLNASGHRAGVVVLCGFPMLFMFNRAIPRDWLALLATAPGLAAASLLMLAFGAWTLDTMFPKGGDRHFRLRAAHKLALERATVAGQSKQGQVPRLGLWVYGAALRRDSARRDSGALLMHLLGPAGHWTQLAASVPVVLAGAALVMFLLRQRASADTLEAIAGGSWTAVSWAMLILLFNYERRFMRLEFSRGEQTLLKLAPAMPGAAGAFNRQLARRLLGAALGEWLLLSALMLGVVAISGAPAEILWTQACLCCLVLPLLAAVLRDHAHRSGSAGWWLGLGLAASLGACFASATLVNRVSGTPVLPAAALTAVLLAVAAVAWRWRRLAGAPHAFPVGRLV